MDILLKAENIEKTFPSAFSLRGLLDLGNGKKTGTKALDGVSFDIGKNRVVGLLGPNGAGKTTLLKIIATLILPDKGRICLCGPEGPQREAALKRSVGLVYAQEKSFYGRLTGRQNLEFFAALYGLSGRETRSRCSLLFKLFDVDYQDKPFDTYSSGMKQRCALIRALLHDPALLLLDEPSKSLDMAAARQLKELLRDRLVRREGKTVLFTTHRIEETAGFCDSFIILRRGKIGAAGTLEDLRRNIQAPTASLEEIYETLCSPNRSHS